MTPHHRPVKPPVARRDRGRARPRRLLLGVLFGLAAVAPLVASVVPARAQAMSESRAGSASQAGASAVAVASAIGMSASMPSGALASPPGGAFTSPPAGALAGPPPGALASPPTGAIASPPTAALARVPTGAPTRTPLALPEPGRIASAQVRHLRVGGLERSYLVQPAPGARGAGRLPVVVLLHAAAQTALDAWRETSLPTLAARDGFLVVAPQAIDRRWNDARGATVDDVRFLRAVIADAIAQHHGDPSAVFMVGIASGGFMAMRFACDAGEALRAGASVLSALPVALARDCKSPRPLPWLAIAGTDDPQIPFGGQAFGTLRHGEAQPALESAQDSFRFWADRAGCASAVMREPLTDPARDERHRWAERVRRSACVAGQVSALVVLHGSGHAVPGASINSRLSERVAGPAAPELDGGTLVWEHFNATLLK